MTNNIIEIFSSIQGEGKHIGTPSLFIRFGKCNLKCQHCDTKYSWEEEGKYSIQDAINFIKDNNEYKHVVITGGEPLLYQEDIITIIESNFVNLFTIETNGTFFPSKRLRNLMATNGLWSVSPKLSYDTEIFLSIINNFVYTNNIQFKIVIVNTEDIDKLFLLVKDIKKELIIQPDGNRTDYSEACKELAEFVIANKLTSVRILPQLHRIMWGQKRGV